jgi:peptidyl-prolyl cis-trans isomerase SurA
MRLCETISILALATVLLSGAPRLEASSQTVVDRIVATVNGHVILQSEWNEELSYEAVLSGRRLSDFSDEERKAALDRLIDQELLAEQMATASFSRASEAEAEAKVTEARSQNHTAGENQAWTAALAEFRLTEKDLVEHVRRQLDVMRLVDARLRPVVQVDAKSVEAYYREKFVPQLQAGSTMVALDDVSDKIRDLLTEQKVNELLVSWLHTLRSEGAVKVNEPASDAQEIR